MILIRIIGGLGNQMFQYAAARTLADHLDVELYLDLSEFKSYKLFSYELDKFCIRAKVATDNELQKFSLWRFRLAQLCKKLQFNNRFYIEPSFCFTESWYDLNDQTYLSGYFQSEKYFISGKKLLLDEFQLKNILSDKNFEIKCLAENSTSVSIHVRRGDFITDKKTLKIHGICSQNYYSTAIKKMQDSFDNIRFFVFSNDLAWAKETLDVGSDAVFVSGNEKTPENDLYLMTRCQHHIIANSSFSWWGAWLGENSNQSVIVPEPWFNSKKIVSTDLLPAKWIKIKK